MNIYYIYTEYGRNGISVAATEQEALQNAIKALSRRRADGAECGFTEVRVQLMDGNEPTVKQAKPAHSFDVDALIARLKAGAEVVA